MKTQRSATTMLVACVVLFVTYEALAFYNPETGRWLSRHPFNEDGGLNLYAWGAADLTGLASREVKQSRHETGAGNGALPAAMPALKRRFPKSLPFPIRLASFSFSTCWRKAIKVTQCVSLALTPKSAFRWWPAGLLQWFWLVCFVTVGTLIAQNRDGVPISV